MALRCATTLVTVPSKVKPQIGVFGGAFDPPHQAHVALAQAAFVQLGLSRLLLIPTGQAAHRPQPLSPGQHRLAMLKLALADGSDRAPPGFACEIDARELSRPGVSFMVDTLRELQQENPDAELILLMGADQAQSLTHWHRWAEILGLATVAVAPRELPPQDKSWAGPFAFESHPQARLIKLDFPLIPISATALRARLANPSFEPPPDAATSSPLVGPSVASYIAEHQLYKVA